jgi:hypothetical protein
MQVLHAEALALEVLQPFDLFDFQAPYSVRQR